MGAEEPSAELEAGDAVVVMKGDKTLGDMANRVGASNAPLFVRVGLPPTVHAGERWRVGAVVHGSVHDEDMIMCRGFLLCVRVCASAGSKALSAHTSCHSRASAL